MAAPKHRPYLGLHRAAKELMTAHAGIREGVATHAEKHVAATDAKRKEVAVNGAIERGARASASQV
jgi:hypothetical protein